MKNPENKQGTAVLGGGCSWCLDAIFSRCKGVHDVMAGYAGGDVPKPTYDQVSGGRTGHAEVVQIHFDPTVITFDDLLHIYFTIHNPTTINRQGNDVGPQYRSVIFYTSKEQQETAKKVMKETETAKVYDDPIVTELLPLDQFFPAEDYHQHYFDKNPDQAYCQIVIEPKISKFREKYRQFYK